MKSCFLFFLLTCHLFADGQQSSSNTVRFIEITGTHETEVTPDELWVKITLLERTENKGKISIETLESELKKNLKDLGIDLSLLTLNSADADYRKIRTFKKDVMISKSYMLKLNTAEKLSKVYERLDAINVQDAYVSKYTHSKILLIQKETRISAIKAAKDKANYLLEALGQQLGAPIQITETENYVQDGQQFNIMAARNSLSRFDDASESSSSDEISFKKIKVRSSFLVKYEIITK
jgi:uncharacterized protein YggE